MRIVVINAIVQKKALFEGQSLLQEEKVCDADCDLGPCDHPIFVLMFSRPSSDVTLLPLTTCREEDVR